MWEEVEFDSNNHNKQAEAWNNLPKEIELKRHMKINEALVFSISQSTGKSSYDIFLHFTEIFNKIIKLSETDKYKKRLAFKFYGEFPGTNFQYVMSFSKRENEYVRMTKDDSLIWSWGDYQHYRQTGNCDSIKSRVNLVHLDLNVMTPQRSIVFDEAKLAEIEVDKELLGFSTLAEAEDPKKLAKRLKVEKLDEMLEKANTCTKTESIDTCDEED